MLAQSSDPASFHVLLVDDSVVNQKLLSGFLNRYPCTVTVADNGEQAVEQVLQQEFDVVLMDVQMPVMDGLEATQLIRRQEAASDKHTPIIAVTAGVDRQPCLEAGMDDHMPKPVRADLLREKLEGVFDL